MKKRKKRKEKESLYYRVLSEFLAFGSHKMVNITTFGFYCHRVLSLSLIMTGLYVFQLPTTGSLSFSDYFADGLDVYTTQISEATQARANLRAVLKESKHTDGDKDYLKLLKASLILFN
jgi:hypothetical protein